MCIITTKCLTETIPVFSWILKEGNDKNQLSYHITVSTADGNVVWDSNTVLSDNSTHIEYGGEKLKENTKYFWKVIVTTDKGKYESDTSHFITGLYDFDSLKWITADKEINSPIITRGFELEEVCDYVPLNICGLGFFEVYINGLKVSDEIMSPVRTDYSDVIYKNLKYPYNSTTRKIVKYLCYEVSKYLKTGKNEISVWLGNGWYRQTGRIVEGTFDYGDELKMFFRLTNGSQVIESDESCLCMESPIIYDNIFYGEIYDSRIKGTKKSVKLTSAPTGTLEKQLCPPERILNTYIPTRLNDVYDAGKCLTGFVEISCTGKSGDKVELYFSEDIDESGNLDYTSTVGYEESDKDQIQKDVFILNGTKDQTYVPKFVWHAFRYFKIVAPDSVKISDVKVHYVCTDLKIRTSFSCSEDLLNMIHEISINTQLTNTHGCVPMDCPHRERLGYTCDGQLSSLSVMYNFDAEEMYSKWVNDIINAQNLETGFVPHTAPFNGGGGGPAWGSGIAVVPWNMYMQYGNKEIIKKAAPHIKLWIEYLTEKRENGLVTCEEPGSWCLGDWCMPSKYPWSEPHLDEIKIPPMLVNTVYYIYCIDIYTKMLDILGEKVEEWIEEERLLSVEAVNSLLKDGLYVTGEQGSNLFPLFAGIVPKGEEAKVLENAIESIRKNNFRFETGISGTKFVLNVLDKFERNDIALKMMLGSEYPSLGNMIKNGATSLWETWEGNGSRNHTAFSSADSWLFYGLSGIKPLGGYKEFTLKPHFARELNFLETSIETEYGTISVNWHRTEKNIEVVIEVPFNTTAHVNLNGDCFDLTAGVYKKIIN